MEVVVTGGEGSLPARTQMLLRRMLCPFTGLSQEIGFVMRGPLEPRVAVAGGEMTGVHVIRGTEAPPRGSYHIGGTGTTYAEAMIRTLGETVERYAQFVASAGDRSPVSAASLDEQLESGHEVLTAPGLQLFSAEQHARVGFPFASIDPATEIGWIRAGSLFDGSECYLPAQQAIPGYRGIPGEPRFAEGVTTGGAAHTSKPKALRNALLELVQIDAAMGHWYAGGEAVQLAEGRRTQAVERLIRRSYRRGGELPGFYWLRSADLPGFAIAAVFEAEEEPRCAVGLGCDLRLSQAIYKAFLEGAAVAQLAKVTLFKDALEPPREGVDAARIYDLDSNVAHYASSDPETVTARFDGHEVSSDELPPDVDAGALGDVKHLVDGFAECGKRIAGLNLTTPDVRSLGFHVLRVWSPDVLTLSLPSAPPALHLRFAAYGGFARETAHPYP